MIKYFCDKCGEEVHSLIQLVDINIEKNTKRKTDSISTALVSIVTPECYQVCATCADLISNFIKNEKVQTAD